MDLYAERPLGERDPRRDPLRARANGQAVRVDIRQDSLDPGIVDFVIEQAGRFVPASGLSVFHVVQTLRCAESGKD